MIYRGDAVMLRLDLWRRLFHHSALGLASACLLYAEAFFLPGPLLVGLYLLAGVQVLAFAADGRRWILPSWAANLLAGAVGGGGVAWITSELSRPDSVLASMPLPAGLLPYIGPMLIGLLVIKLFRPAASRDFWLLQGVGSFRLPSPAFWLPIQTPASSSRFCWRRIWPRSGTPGVALF